MDATHAQSTVDSMRRERDALAREVEKLASQISEMEGRIEDYDQTVEGMVRIYGLDQSSEADGIADEAAPRRTAGSKSLREYIEEFFDLHKDQWVTTREIHDGVVKLGWTTNSKQSINVLRNTLGPWVQTQGRIERKPADDGQQVLYRWHPKNAEDPVEAGPSGSANPQRGEGGDVDDDHRGDPHQAAVDGDATRGGP